MPSNQSRPDVSSPDEHSIKVEVPATSANCGPGFDCLGIALSLWNRLELRLAPADSLEVSGEGALQLRGETTSLAHRAARAAWNELGLSPTGFALSMRNAVPFARGLGSSSAAIVAGIFAANEWARSFHNTALSKQQLLDLATRLEGHPDNVAPALSGGLAVCAVREDGRTFVVNSPVAVAPKFVVWIPEEELSTEKARAALPSVYLRADCIFNTARAALLVAALATGDFDALAESLRDHVHQDFRAPLVPGWMELNETAHEAGALGTTLSGAGPTILFWLSPEDDAARFAQQIENGAQNYGFAGRVMELSVASGARLASAV